MSAFGLLGLALTLLCGPGRAESDLTFDLDGYYRVRGHVFPNLFEAQEGGGTYMLHRLKLQPSASFRDAKFNMEIDALDDVLWGDNESHASTALFAGDPSTTGLNGAQGPSLNLTRAWLEAPLPVGLIRVGRQPSQWGMGLLANSGDGFDDTFGDNHAGATYDRVIFATRPVSIAQKIAGHADTKVPLVVAFGIDRLVEDPLIQFYGYACKPGVVQGEAAWDARCDRDGDGVTDATNDYKDDTRVDADRRQDWWADADDDVYEMVYVVSYKGENLRLGDREGDLIGGIYVVNRRQKETSSNIVISDVYFKARYMGILAEFEGLNIRGRTNAIVLPGAYDPYGQLDNPLYKEADIWGYVGRLGFEGSGIKAYLEHGYASGDDYVADERFTGRPLHPDYNVGLLLYEEILARVTAATWTASADGLWSQGGVYNSRYLYPTLIVRPRAGMEVIGAWLVAWPDKPDGSRILCAKGDDVECAETKATASTLGWEADLAFKQRWREHLSFSLEGAYARTTDRIPLASADLDPSGKFFTVQSRIAFEF
jgi:hypothetical protein